MEPTVADIVTALAQGKMANANESFARMMAQKVNDALDERKVALASQVYNQAMDESVEVEESTEELDEYAVDAKGHKSSTGGLTQKGRDYYNRRGGHLQAPVTTKPSKLKKGSKAYNRRKSFCARMSGVKGPMKDEHGKPTRKALALRKWNC